LATPPTSSHVTDRVTAAAAPTTFKQKIYVKLDDKNYLQWKQQVEGVPWGTNMVKYAVLQKIPSIDPLIQL